MKIENNIGWCDETGNKVTGCDKVSPGCKNCYAEVGTRARVLRGQGIETWGAKGQRYPVKDFASKVRRLNKLCVCDRCHNAAPVEALSGDHICIPQGQCPNCDGPLRRIRLFADSNSDWLDDKWPIETLADLLKDIHDCLNIDFQLLTKRPENFESRMHAAWAIAKDDYNPMIARWLASNPPSVLPSGPSNVWLGVSVEDQKRADERIPMLLRIPAKVRFLSVEPLLESVCIRNGFDQFEHSADCTDEDCALAGGPHDCEGEVIKGISWVIVGGESGKGRRDCGVEAICDVARQCVAAGVPCFVKQASAFKSGQRGDIPEEIWNLKQFPTVEKNLKENMFWRLE